jgi:hypothetical protein
MGCAFFSGARACGPQRLDKEKRLGSVVKVDAANNLALLKKLEH